MEAEESKNIAAANHIESALEAVHKLSGCLTGISAGLYCSKLEDSAESLLACVSGSESLLSEAQIEIIRLRELLLELAKVIGSEES
jgi:hypothetical protein